MPTSPNRRRLTCADGSFDQVAIAKMIFDLRRDAVVVGTASYGGQTVVVAGLRDFEECSRLAWAAARREREELAWAAALHAGFAQVEQAEAAQVERIAQTTPIEKIHGEVVRLAAGDSLFAAEELSVFQRALTVALSRQHAGVA